ncbi:Gfo/Idh/MocA family protein [Granulicella aggregans]|uniref:Gfo/Idh/MocA family protein n=1 Tax=Granulicella aggregans TaxID=474949 RepID=UPI0021E0EB54|nr:Gfo/Idh/MocA family oxidoreductase [Granulicella aggregans]
MNRRELLVKGSQAVSGIMILKSSTAFGYQANSAVLIGLLGCGNRGTAVATSFSQNTAGQVVALADIFPDQLAAGKAHFDKVNGSLTRAAIDSKLLFRGPHAFEELAASQDVDVIQISTPPFFHVQHLAAAVDAGKHVYCEKPVGIDVRQAKQALEIAKRVKPHQSVDVGFQCRMAPPIAAIEAQIKAGALGKVATVSGNYNAPASTEKTHPGIKPDEYRLRNWLWDKALSGDILVEQNIHIIDLCNWMLGAHPLKATATGGRNVLKHYGDCWDNYEVEYTYPGGVHFTFASTQFGSDGKFDAGLKLFGSAGSATVPYSGPIQITGAQAWEWKDSRSNAPGSGQFAANGSFLDNLEFADRDKDRSFIDSITSGPAHNQIAAGVETALSCMLGRMAGYTGREVTWEDLLAHGETYQMGFSLDQFA